MTSYDNYLTWRESTPEFMGMSYADYKKYENLKDVFEKYNCDDQYFIEYLKCEQLYIKYDAYVSYKTLFMHYVESKLNPKTANAPFEWYENYVKSLTTGERWSYQEYLAAVYKCG
jgi:hypothetical protein